MSKSPSGREDPWTPTPEVGRSQTPGPARGGRGPGPLPRAWFELLLQAFPKGPRGLFGDSMRETFHLRYQEFRMRGLHSVLRFLLKTTVNMAGSGLLERYRAWSSRRRRNGGRAVKGEKERRRGMGAGMMEDLRQDLAFAFRSLTRNPAFSLAALLTLALGIGATTSIFSVVNGILLRPLPYADQDRLVTVYAAFDQEPQARGNMSGPDILDLADLDAMGSLVGFAGGNATLTGMGEARVIPGARVTRGILATFGLKPFMGRDLRPEESIPGAPRSVLVGYGFWQEEMGGRADVLGQTLQLQGDSYEIVGVAPQGFDYPRGARLWRPHYRSDDDCGRGVPRIPHRGPVGRWSHFGASP